MFQNKTFVYCLQQQCIFNTLDTEQSFQPCSCIGTMEWCRWSRTNQPLRGPLTSWCYSLSYSDRWYPCCFKISNAFALPVSLYLVLMFKGQRFFLHMTCRQEEVTMSRRAGTTGLYFLSFFFICVISWPPGCYDFLNFLLSCENHCPKQKTDTAVGQKASVSF